jgi:hypothetical protein
MRYASVPNTQNKTQYYHISITSHLHTTYLQGLLKLVTNVAVGLLQPPRLLRQLGQVLLHAAVVAPIYIYMRRIIKNIIK